MKTVKVVAAIIHRDGKIFATARGHGAATRGAAGPGGKIEPCETPEEALRREILEEPDTELRVEELFDTI